MVNVGLFTEGTDLPGVETVFIARPTLSKVLFRQMVGRGMRGPAVGGSPLCKIVMLHDEVHGLVKETLATSFTGERDALAALEIEPDDPIHRPGKERKRVEISKEPEKKQILNLIDYVEALATTETTALTEAALDGWWVARARDRIAFLPVFDSFRWATEPRLKSWADNKDAENGVVDLLYHHLPEGVVTAFLEAAERPNADVKYIQLADDAGSSIGQLPRMLRAVDDDAQVPAWWLAARLGTAARTTNAEGRGRAHRLRQRGHHLVEE